MPRSKQEIEADIQKLAETIETQVESARKVYGSIRPLLVELGIGLDQALEPFKPQIKKQKIAVELLLLKARAHLLDQRIKKARREESERNRPKEEGP